MSSNTAVGLLQYCTAVLASWEGELVKLHFQVAGRPGRPQGRGFNVFLAAGGDSVTPIILSVAPVGEGIANPSRRLGNGKWSKSGGVTMQEPCQRGSSRGVCSYKSWHRVVRIQT